jgi:hypothetical protein
LVDEVPKSRRGSGGGSHVVVELDAVLREALWVSFRGYTVAGAAVVG